MLEKTLTLGQDDLGVATKDDKQSSLYDLKRQPPLSDMKTPHVQQQQSKIGYLKLLWMRPVLFYTLTSQSEHNYTCRRVNSCHMPTWWLALWSYPNPRDGIHQQMLKFSPVPRGADWTVHPQPILVPFQHMLLKFWCFAGTTISGSINACRRIPKQCGLAPPGEAGMLLAMFPKDKDSCHKLHIKRVHKYIDLALTMSTDSLKV